MKQLAVILSLLGALMLAAQEAKTPDANRTEAARFFEEYRGKLKAVARCQNRRGPEYDALEPLINSACALDPENPHYRREAILLALSRVHAVEAEVTGVTCRSPRESALRGNPSGSG